MQPLPAADVPVRALRLPQTDPAGGGGGGAKGNRRVGLSRSVWSLSAWGAERFTVDILDDLYGKTIA